MTNTDLRFSARKAVTRMTDLIWIILISFFCGSVVALLYTIVKYLVDIKVFFEIFCDVLRLGLKQQSVEVTGDE